MGNLYLDGINDLTSILEEYRLDIPNGCFRFKKDIWLRVTLFVHIALSEIRTCATQSLRGLSHLCAGIIHLDGERFVMGLNDYLSLLIQVVALPVLGLLIFFLPKTGYRLLYRFKLACDVQRQTSSDIVYQHEVNKPEACHNVKKGISQAVMGLFGSLVASIHTLTATLEYLLSLSFREVVDSVEYTAPLIAHSFIDGFSDCANKEYSKRVFAAHRIALESFNPSPLF